MECHGNACHNLNFYCNNSDTQTSCSVDCNDGINECPNGWKNGIYTGNYQDIKDSNLIYKNIEEIDVEEGYLMNYLIKNYSIRTSVKRTITECKDENNICHNYLGCRYNSFTINSYNDSVCYAGAWSCDSTTITSNINSNINAT